MPPAGAATLPCRSPVIGVHRLPHAPVKMDSDLAYYVATHYRRLMTPAERAADLHLATTYKGPGGRSHAAAHAEVPAEGTAAPSAVG